MCAIVLYIIIINIISLQSLFLHLNIINRTKFTGGGGPLSNFSVISNVTRQGWCVTSLQNNKHYIYPLLAREPRHNTEPIYIYLCIIIYRRRADWSDDDGVPGWGMVVGEESLFRQWQMVSLARTGTEPWVFGRWEWGW